MRGETYGPAVSTLSNVPLGPDPIVFLSIGDDTSCVISNTSVVKCWGRNDYGQVGNGVVGGNVGDAPGEVAALSGINLSSLGGAKPVYISQGCRSTYILLSDGSVTSFGLNELAQLGLGGRAAVGAAYSTVGSLIDLGTGRGPKVPLYT